MAMTGLDIGKIADERYKQGMRDKEVKTQKEKMRHTLHKLYVGVKRFIEEQIRNGEIVSDGYYMLLANLLNAWNTLEKQLDSEHQFSNANAGLPYNPDKNLFQGESVKFKGDKRGMKTRFKEEEK